MQRARGEMFQNTRKNERTEATPEETTGQWKWALINDWTKTWFVGTYQASEINYVLTIFFLKKYIKNYIKF
jgi:hypothetical protein